MNLLRAVTTVGGFTLVSRILGFLRDILVASFLGTGMIADALFVAFKFPNLFRRLFAEGAFNAAFVPLFAGKLETDGRESAREFADRAFSVLLWTLLVATAVFELAMPWALMAFAPGFVDEPEKFDLTVTLTRITFPYLMLISGVSLMAGVLNSLGRFAAAAATPILLNLCLIGAVLGLTPFLPSPGHALAWGFFAAGVVQFAWLYLHCGRSGLWLRLPRPRLADDVKLLLKRVVPGAIGAGIYQINLVIDTVIASLLAGGSISYLFFADRVTQLPLGVVGVATGTALLPLLSRHLRAGETEAAHHGQNRALEITLLLTLPAAVALWVLAEPVIRVLFERGAFDSTSTEMTAAALAVYATGLPAYVLVKTLAPGFFAREDTKTPVVVAAGAMAVNLVLNLILMGPFQHVGIAMATATSSWLNAIVLAWLLWRRDGLKPDRRLISRLPRMALAAACMGIGLGYGLDATAELLIGSQAERIAGLSVLVAGGVVGFAFLALGSGAARPSDLRSLRRRSLGS